ncbi:MAG: 23S rRNA (pseudouridine(1915)-N(3))-methyltransferase RlmH [Lachnospiraceae bacterium]|nr:23S rRNA (pseudouridine(1915)-N(3))-methyltransferase RlmH [Lachnospiraceae bacterium]
MRIEILCVGKIKEDFFAKAIAEYSKRIGKYCRLTITEVTDEKTPDGAGEAINAQILKKEGERILGKLREETFPVALAIEGKDMSSTELAGFVTDLMNSGKSDITFIIGGSLGLDSAVLDRAKLKLSFSRMTFPHQLMRIILLEQVYRAFKIINNEPYHK